MYAMLNFFQSYLNNSPSALFGQIRTVWPRQSNIQRNTQKKRAKTIQVLSFSLATILDSLAAFKHT